MKSFHSFIPSFKGNWLKSASCFLLVLGLSFTTIAMAGRSREEMGVKFNQKKAPVTQVAPAQPETKPGEIQLDAADIKPEPSRSKEPKPDMQKTEGASQ